MANALLRGLAIAAGTGLAVGLTSGRTRLTSVSRVPRYRVAREEPPPMPAPKYSAPSLASTDQDFLNIDPLLDRVERLEELVDGLNRQPRSAGVPEDYVKALADLERRIEENSRDLVLLREEVTAAERRAMESVASVQREVEKTRAEIPAIVEQTVAPRIDDLRSRFAAEIDESQQRMLAVFERAIDEKISSRIGAIERTLAEQAGSIEALNTRAAETDNNLQRLVSAIEKLCERAQLIPAPQEQHFTPSGYAPRPFESQLHDAIRRNPEPPLTRNAEPAVEVPAPAFTGTEDRPVKKSRFLFRNLIVAGFAFLASRFPR